MDPQNQTTAIPIKIGQTRQYGPDQYVKVLSVEQGRWFHKIYISLVDGKVRSNKIIKILNDRICEFGGTVYLKGNSLESVLINGNEII